MMKKFYANQKKNIEERSSFYFKINYIILYYILQFNFNFSFLVLKCCKKNLREIF